LSGQINHNVEAILEAASTIGMREFRPCDIRIREFCNEVDAADHHSSVAAQILETFCVAGGSYNDFFPGIRLALGYLDSMAGSLEISQLDRAIKDLKDIISDAPTLATLESWADSHFS
jgi:hypothetical protein